MHSWPYAYALTLLAPAAFSDATLTAINDTNIHVAVDAWLENPSTATATYGNITEWDVSSAFVKPPLCMDCCCRTFPPRLKWQVSSVTDMSDMFYFATSFNADLAAWNVRLFRLGRDRALVDK